MLRARVHFDQDAVGARREAGERERRDDRADAGGMARIDDDRQMRALANERDAVEIQRVPRRPLERPDSPLAQDDLGVPVGQDVLRRREPLFDRRSAARA